MSASTPESPDPDLLFGNSPSGLLGAAMETIQPDSQAVPDNWEPPTPEHIAVLLPQYRIEHLIGRGGMGAVYKGRQLTLNRPVAIKILPAELARNREFVARFHREAQLLASLSHQGIVTIFDFGQTAEGHLYFVMEFVDGTDLHRVVHKSKLEADQALKLTVQICEALQYAHDMGVIHRDIKPANVLVTRDGRAKLADFGLAMKPAEHGLDVPQPPQPEDFNPHDPLGIAALRITKPGTAMGTPDYAAPEVYDGKADSRSDIYALGIMLYEMLTGAPPKGYYQLPSSKAKVDSRIDRVVVKALEPDPEARYQRASEMRLAVENATRPLPGNAPPPPKPPQGKATTPSQRPPTGKTPARSVPAQPVRPPAARKSASFYRQFVFAAGLLLAVGAAYDSQHGWEWTRMVQAVFGFRAERKTIQRIEGEAMKVVSVSSGKAAPADMRRFTSAGWSGSAHLLWRNARENDTLVLQLPVSEAGRQGVRGVFSQSHDMGIAEVSLDGVPVNGSPFDFQAEEITASDIFDFGVFELTAGNHDLTVKIVGTNARKDVGNGLHVVGLDYLQLEPPAIAPSFAAPGTDVALAARPSASQPFNSDPVRNMNSGKEIAGRKSGDRSLPRQTWQPRKGGMEWAQYEWETPQYINECRVFWFDDSTASGECALPAFWRLLYREPTGGWVPVEAKIPDAEDDKWSVVKFPAVRTTALRISVQCKEDWSAGICHWKAIAADPAEVSDPASRAHPDLFLGDLSPLHAQCGWGAYRANAYTAIDLRDGRIVCVGGKDCAQYLWAHPASRYEFAIPEGYTRFTATGIGPSSLATKEPIRSYGSWSYTVLVDGKTLFTSPPLGSFANRQVPMDVRFPAGSRRLTLITDPLGNGNSDHAFVAYPLLKADTAPAANTKSVEAASTDVQSSSTSGEQPSQTPDPATATRESTFINSLGMKFVPVPDTNLLFCIHETRRQDYAAYAGAVADVDQSWAHQVESDGSPVGQLDDHPVVAVSREDAERFCRWLSEKDGHTFRLPTSQEWGIALGNDGSEFPWGSGWPPPEGAGNYADTTWLGRFPKERGSVPGYSDSFVTTAPVMSFKPNRFGLFDMGGNVWELMGAASGSPSSGCVIRGAGWSTYDRNRIASSCLYATSPTHRDFHHGFRVVLVTTSVNQSNTSETLHPSCTSSNDSAALADADFEKTPMSAAPLCSTRT